VLELMRNDRRRDGQREHERDCVFGPSLAAYVRAFVLKSPK
jgi:hypothetical protein